MSVSTAIRKAVRFIVGKSPELIQSEAFAARLHAVSKRDNEVWAECEKWIGKKPSNDAEHEQERQAWEAWIDQLRYGYGPPMFSEGAIR